MSPIIKKFIRSIIRFQVIEEISLDEAITTSFRIMKDEQEVKWLSTNEIGCLLQTPKMQKYREMIINNKNRFSK